MYPGYAGEYYTCFYFNITGKYAFKTVQIRTSSTTN